MMVSLLILSIVLIAFSKINRLVWMDWFVISITGITSN